jgi:hypothetical protein
VPLQGQSPINVAAADLRGIGILDLIVTEADNETVGVLPGKGDGTFGSEVDYHLPGIPTCLAIDDFTGDGHKDILVGMQGDFTVGEIALLPGDGAGHFGAPIYEPYEHPIQFAILSLAYNIAETDLNGDGFPDLVVAEINEDPIGEVTTDISVLLNQRDGTFKAGQMVDDSWFFYITNVAVGDVNNDGCADIVEANSLGAATLFLGNCDGTFQTQGVRRDFGLGDIPGGLALADVNGDGKLDIVTSSVVFFDSIQTGLQPGDMLSVLLGDGQGNFNLARIYRGQPSMYSLALADLNGDGKFDIITASQDADLVTVFLNDGSGGFGQPAGGYIGYPALASNSGAAEVGSVGSGFTDVPYSGFKIADVNGDGKPDLVLLESERNYPEPLNVAVLLNQGSGKFSDPVRSAVIDTSSQNPNAVGDWAVADFRNAGHPDFVAVASPNSGGASYIAFAKNNGDGTFTHLPLETVSGAQGLIGVGDFNSDGKLDFVVLGSVSGTSYTLNVFLGNGDGTFTAGYSASADSAGYLPSAVWVGDFNGDGKPDILALLTGGPPADSVYEFLGKGDGTFAPGKVVLQNVGPVNVADLNHDGIPDIVEMVMPAGSPPMVMPLQYAVYLGQRDGSFTPQNTYPLNDGVLAYQYTYYPGVVLGDFNGDGNIDIAAFQGVLGYSSVASMGWHTVLQILAGNGDGTFTPTYTISDFNQFIVPSYAADLNGDGKADLLQLGSYDSSYYIVPAVTGPALQLNLVAVPVVGSVGSARVTLAVPSSSATTVQLAASDPALTLPASVTIPANSVSQDFQFQIGRGFQEHRVFSLQASLGGKNATAYGWLESVQTGFSFKMSTSQVTLPGQETPDYTMQVTPIHGYSSTVAFSCSGLPAWATCQFDHSEVQLLPGAVDAPNLVVSPSSAAVVGSYPFTVVATDGFVTQQVSATLNIGDFGISLSPLTATVPPSGSTNYSLTISSVNNYNGVVQICASGLPVGAAMNCNGLIAGTSNWPLTIQTTNVLPGNYTVTVTGTGGSVTRHATATLQVQAAGSPDFTGTISPASSTLSVGMPGTFNLALQSENWFTGVMTLQCANIPSGTTCAFNPVTPTLGANDSVSDTVSVQVNPSVAFGSYPFTVVATSGSFTHNFTATLVVKAPPPPSFTGSMSPSSATISVGQSANFNITLNSQNGATGAITLQCPNLPSGTSCTFNPTSPTLPANGNVTDQLTVQVNSRPSTAPRGTPTVWPTSLDRLQMVGLLAALTIGLAVLVEMRRRTVSACVADRLTRCRLSGRLAVLFSLVILFLASASCGGGGGGSSPPPATQQPVAFIVTVQATGAGVSVAQTIGTLTITVN